MVLRQLVVIFWKNPTWHHSQKYIPDKYLNVKNKTSNILGDNVRDYSWYQKTFFLKWSKKYKC